MVANVGLAWASEVYGAGAEAAAQTWTAIGIIQDGIGGGVEVVGGIWVLGVSAITHEGEGGRLRLP